jgi:DHA3 family tetracycline resistance protein-like MFS transporter
MIAKIIWQYYGLLTINNLGMSLSSAMYVSFLMSHDLDLLQVNLVNATFFITLFVCEIPTGTFADVCGRKASYILSCVIISIGLAVYGFSATLGGFILAEVLIAIGRTFESGAFNAWFVDRLKHHGHETDLARLFSRGSITARSMTIIGSIIGASMATFQPASPWFLGAILLTVSALVGMTVHEEYRAPRKFALRADLRAMGQRARSGSLHILHTHGLRLLLLNTTVHVAMMQAINMYWQPFFDPDRKLAWMLGFLFAGIQVSAIGGNLLAPWLLRRVDSPEQMITGAQIATGISVIACAWAGNFWLTVSLFMLHEVFRGSIDPIRKMYLHSRARSEDRATTESLESIAHHLGGTFGLVTSGIIAKHLGIATTWTLCGGLLIVAVIIILPFWKKQSR